MSAGPRSGPPEVGHDAGAAPKAGKDECWSKASSLQHPAEGLGRMSPRLGSIGHCGHSRESMKRKTLPRLLDRMTDGLRVPGVVLSGRFGCIGELPIDIRPRYVGPARSRPPQSRHPRPAYAFSIP